MGTHIVGSYIPKKIVCLKKDCTGFMKNKRSIAKLKAKYSAKPLYFICKKCGASNFIDVRRSKFI